MLKALKNIGFMLLNIR